MRTGIILLTLLFVLADVQVASGQAMPLEVDLDHATFAYGPDHSLLEVYLAFGAASLPYDADSSGYRASVPMHLSVLRNTDAALTATPREPVLLDTLALEFVVPDTAALGTGQVFVHQTRRPVPPGEYELRLLIPADDARGRQQLELRRDVRVPDFSELGQVALSDVTLASTIARSTDREDVFYKNGLVIRPNANQLYGHGLSTLFYYAEVYNAEDIAAEDDTYTVFAYVAEANRPQPLPDLQRRLHREARTPDALAGSFNLATLPSGSYFLHLAVLDENNEAIVEQARKFFVYNPQVERAPTAGLESSFERSPYATMTDEEVEKSLAHISIIATEREERRYKGIEDLDERRRFLMEFWNRRDPDPNTSLNEFREEFYARLQYANQRYTTGRREGWETDRGRVIVKYGPPAQIEPHLYDRDTKPHELWQYNNIPGEGRALFVFADTDGFGEFELLHSSVAGERKSPSWREELRR